jgi:hypothetical protein
LPASQAISRNRAARSGDASIVRVVTSAFFARRVMRIFPLSAATSSTFTAPAVCGSDGATTGAPSSSLTARRTASPSRSSAVELSTTTTT